MFILPSLDEIIQSNKQPEEICEALRAVTVPQKEHHYGDRRGEFIGEVSDAGFRVVSNIWYRNSFLPIITGSIKRQGSRSVIVIKMRMHLLTSVFSAIWLSGVGFFFLIGILVLCVDRSISALTLPCVTAVMIVFYQLMVRGGFYGPARKASRRMRELFGEDDKNYTIS